MAEPANDRVLSLQGADRREGLCRPQRRRVRSNPIGGDGKPSAEFLLPDCLGERTWLRRLALAGRNGLSLLLRRPRHVLRALWLHLPLMVGVLEQLELLGVQPGGGVVFRDRWRYLGTRLGVAAAR